MKRQYSLEKCTAKFLGRIERGGPDECWTVRGVAKSNGGYSIVGGYDPLDADAPRSVGAHRFSYLLHVGPIPEGHVIDHICFNRACVNPAHLQPLTVSENSRRINPLAIAGRPPKVSPDGRAAVRASFVAFLCVHASRLGAPPWQILRSMKKPHLKKRAPRKKQVAA